MNFIFNKTNARFFLRLALGLSFLSAVADRFGYWGVSGSPGVVWGNFYSFLDYTSYLNPWAPRVLSDGLGYLATGLEIILGILLIVGIKLKHTALLSFLLLMAFAVSMTIFAGLKSPFDYSVFTAAAGSLLLYTDVRS